MSHLHGVVRVSTHKKFVMRKVLFQQQVEASSVKGKISRRPNTLKTLMGCLCSHHMAQFVQKIPAYLPTLQFKTKLVLKLQTFLLVQKQKLTRKRLHFQSEWLFSFFQRNKRVLLVYLFERNNYTTALTFAKSARFPTKKHGYELLMWPLAWPTCFMTVAERGAGCVFAYCI